MTAQHEGEGLESERRMTFVVSNVVSRGQRRSSNINDLSHISSWHYAFGTRLIMEVSWRVTEWCDNHHQLMVVLYWWNIPSAVDYTKRLLLSWWVGAYRGG